MIHLFVSRDTIGNAPFFPVGPLPRATSAPRLASWYRRFVDTRAADAAERSLSTALVHGLTMVTHNTADYANIPGLTVVDWLIP